MRFIANDIPALRLEIEREFNAVEAPQQPTAVFACTTARMPPAATYKYCMLLNTTLNILAHSDGTNWIRQDTGATI